MMWGGYSDVLTKNIILPKMFYRTDIGEAFIKKDGKRLKRWGWV